ncbi:MAG: type III polyketide synthase [Bacteroidia bacterium]
MRKVFINSIGTANPGHKIPQKKIAEYMVEALAMNSGEASRLHHLYEATGISHRYSILPDFNGAGEKFVLFPRHNHTPEPTVAERMAVYEKEALALSVAAVEDCIRQVEGFEAGSVTHLLTVSCTGMYAPGLDIELLERLGLNSSVHRTAINYMGCYAAINALKIADAICRAEENATVLMVCVELCSLHFQRISGRNHVVSNALFSDGAAAVLISTSPDTLPSLSIEQFNCEVISNGSKDMAWHISDFGFEMTLSAYVPEMIKGGIRSLTHRLLERSDLKLEMVDLFAIHPGGRKILEVIEEELDITSYDNRYAYSVLEQFGNMSSPTVLFVLKELMLHLEKGDNEKSVLSFAFGPGLTLESMLLKVRN